MYYFIYFITFRKFYSQTNEIKKKKIKLKSVKKIVYAMCNFVKI